MKLAKMSQQQLSEPKEISEDIRMNVLEKHHPVKAYKEISNAPGVLRAPVMELMYKWRKLEKMNRDVFNHPK